MHLLNKEYHPVLPSESTLNTYLSSEPCVTWLTTFSLPLVLAVLNDVLFTELCLVHVAPTWYFSQQEATLVYILSGFWIS